MRLTIARSVALFGALVLLGFLTALGASLVAIDRLMIGGPQYEQIVLGKDLVADILPPPEYVIEAYLEATLAVNEPASAPARAKRLAQLRKDYDDRHAYWLASTTVEPSLRRSLTETSHAEAMRFWTEVEQRLLPALQRGDTAAAAASYKAAAEAYGAHRAVVDDIVSRATTYLAASEAGAAAQKSRLLAVVYGSAALALAILIAGLWGIRGWVVRPITRMTAAMEELSHGELGLEVPFRERADEVGAMARALDVFRANAQETEALRSQREESRHRADQDRAAADADRLAAERERTAVMEALAAGLQRLSHGDLTCRLDSAFPAPYEPLRTDFNEAAAVLSDTLATIARTAAEVRANSVEVSRAAGALAQRTEQQSATLEQTAAALEQIGATMQRASSRSTEARGVVEAASSETDESAHVAGDAMAAIQRIETASRQIGETITLIDDIALQTNLLALNAGVEAARAGEAGRGFALIASEVRELAQRSAEAARTIKQLVTASEREVEAGVELVGRTTGMLGTIRSRIGGASALVAEVAGAAVEQSTALGEINRGVGALDQVTQKNAAMVDETSAASRRLAEQASELEALIGRFRFARAGKAQAARAA